MIASAFRGMRDWRFWRACALVLCAPLLVIACGGGGGGDDGASGTVDGVPTTDLHGDTPPNATTIIVDGRPLFGAINPKDPSPVTGFGDVDVFRFRGTQGVTYALQVNGFTPEGPVNKSLNNQVDPVNGNSITDDPMVLAFLGPDQIAQMANTTGTLGGTPYNVQLNLLEPGVVGDGRFMWLCPVTGTYYVQITHFLPNVGTGNYVISLASSQLGTTVAPLGLPQTSGRSRYGEQNNIVVFDDDGMLEFSGFADGLVRFGGFQWDLTGGGTVPVAVMAEIVGVGAGGNVVSTLADTDPPDTLGVHLHYGDPSAFNPAFSINRAPLSADDPDPAWLSFEVLNGGGFIPLDGRSGQRVSFDLPDGRSLSAAAEIEILESSSSSEEDMTLTNMRLSFSDFQDGRGSEVVASASDLRAITGTNWYMDIHWNTDTVQAPRPIVASAAYGDIHTMFETDFFMNSNNVVGARAVDETVLPRGVVPGTDLPLFYDSSLKVFQVTQNYYSPSPGISIISGEFNAFAGLPVAIHAGGPGEVGPVIIDLGTMPQPENEPDYKFVPGYRNVIKQLSDTEVETLRDAFYTTGFYVQISSPQAPQGLLRGEGFLEIQTFPNDGTRRRVGNEPVPKGSVQFVSEFLDGGAVTVIADGTIIGEIGEAVSGELECGIAIEGQTVGSTFWPGSYYYRAFAEDGTQWEGYFEVASDSCQTIILGLE